VVPGYSFIQFCSTSKALIYRAYTECSRIGSAKVGLDEAVGRIGAVANGTSQIPCRTHTPGREPPIAIDGYRERG